MNLLVKSTEKKCNGPVMKSGIRQPPAKTFMDDMDNCNNPYDSSKMAVEWLRIDNQMG